MASTLLTLLDDLALLMDDVAALSRVAVKQTAGVIGDDLALNAEQVTGMRPDRELPVIWAVAKGALLNKVILVPAALLISAFVPALVTPLLLVGGLVLCVEGFGKLAAKAAASRAPAERTARLAVVASSAADVVVFERARIRGAIRTDFILSAEIVIIALGTMATAPLPQQVITLSLIGVGITVLVYGAVAGLVKIDDVGLRLHRGDGPRRTIGALLLRAAPRLMQALSVLGTAAMFLVGGSIVIHGVPALEALAGRIVEPIRSAGLPAALMRALLDAVAGVLAGALVTGVLALGRGLIGRRATP